MNINDLIEIIKKYSFEDGETCAVTAETNLINDLNVTSLQMMCIVFELESKFNVTLKSEDLIRIKTVNDVFELCKGRSIVGGKGV